ncbi:hypothetical protein ACO2KH_14310 [Leptospira terpstrae]
MHDEGFYLEESSAIINLDFWKFYRHRFSIESNCWRSNFHLR